MTEHLSDRILLRYLDGELSRADRNNAAKHLESCWKCRAKLGDLEVDIGIIVDAQAFVLASLRQPPPTRRREFNRQLDEAAGSRRLARRLPLRQRITVSGLLAAAGIVICSVLWFFPAKVTAKQVLEHLAVTDNKRLQVQSRELLLQRVLIKRAETQSRRLAVGTVDCWMLSGRVYWRLAQASVAGTALQHHAVLARTNDLLPLSLAAYQAWLNRAGGPLYLQQAPADQQIVLVANSIAPSSGLQQVRIVVVMATWQVSKMEIKFANEEYEVSEERIAVIPRSQAPLDVLASLESPGKTSNPQSSQAALSRRPLHIETAVKRNLDDSELDVWWQLHRLQADLGEPIQVTSGISRLVVTARGVTPQRRAQIDRVLSGRQDVLLQFDPVPHTAREARQVGVFLPYRRLAPLPALRQNDQLLTDFFGSFTQRETFTGLILEREGTLQSHLYAVRNLARRFDATREAALSGTAKQRLYLLVHDHLETATAELISLQTILDPLFRQYANADHPRSNNGPSVDIRWQTCSNVALSSINSADRLLREFLTTADASTPPEQGAPAVQDSLRQAGVTLQYCMPKP